MGTATKQHKKVPELRFTGFPEWQETNLGEVFSLVTDYTANGSFAALKENVKYYSEDNYAVLVRTTDLEKSTFVPARFTDKRGYDFLKKTSLSGGELIMSNVGNIGKVYKAPYYSKPMTLAPNTYMLKVGSGLSQDYIFQWMLTKYFLNKTLAMVGGGGLAAINKSNLRSISLTMPTSNIEQQKIADFLGSVDAWLDNLRQQKTALETYKRGMMQKLFTQQVRFKDEGGKDYPEWSSLQLSKLAELNPKSTIPEKFYYIDLESVTAGRLNNPKTVTKSSAPSRAQRLLKNGDILFQLVRPYQRNNLLFNFAEGTYVASTGYAQLRVKCNNEYLFHYMHTTKFVNDVLLRCTGTSYPAITTKELGNIKVPNPDQEEQQKIADFLTALDKTIATKAEEITKVEQWKKGLMQKMFV